jgi:hypothetical protein
MSQALTKAIVDGFGQIAAASAQMQTVTTETKH